jgi:hypothetical protein
MHFQFFFATIFVFLEFTKCDLNYDRYRRSVQQAPSSTASPKYNPIFIQRTKNEKETQKASNDIKNVKDRFMCLDEKMDLLGTYKDTWNCEMIKEFNITSDNTFECTNSYIQVEFQAKHPDPSSSSGKLSTIKKPVTGFLTPDYGEFESEQLYSECKHIRR